MVFSKIVKKTSGVITKQNFKINLYVISYFKAIFNTINL